jgi:hypothetical protein
MTLATSPPARLAPFALRARQACGFRHAFALSRRRAATQYVAGCSLSSAAPGCPCTCNAVVVQRIALNARMQRRTVATPLTRLKLNPRTLSAEVQSVRPAATANVS